MDLRSMRISSRCEGAGTTARRAVKAADKIAGIKEQSANVTSLLELLQAQLDRRSKG